jgi:predicted DNA-binding protein
MTSKKDSTIRVRIGSDTESKLKALCELENDTPSAVVRRLIEGYVEKHPMTNTFLDVNFKVSNYPKSNPDSWYIFNLEAELAGGDSLLDEEELIFLLPEFYDDRGEPYRVDSAYYHRKSFPNCIGQKGRFIGAKLTNRKWKGAIFVYRDKLLDQPDSYEIDIMERMKEQIILGVSHFIAEMKLEACKESVIESLISKESK